GPRARGVQAGRADRNHAIDLAERDRRHPQGARCVGVERRDDVADEGFVLRALGAKAWRFIAAPYDGIGRALDLLDLVTIDGALVAGEVEDAAAASAQRLPHRDPTRIAHPP